MSFAIAARRHLFSLMVKDAIRGYIESLVKHGENIPTEPGTATKLP
jgi:hypothetical protein